jgi:hypothetical protein
MIVGVRLSDPVVSSFRLDSQADFYRRENYSGPRDNSEKKPAAWSAQTELLPGARSGGAPLERHRLLLLARTGGASNPLDLQCLQLLGCDQVGSL